MRIGIFSNNFEPMVSGVSLSVQNFEKGLEQLGHKVFVFAPKFKDHKETREDVFRYRSFKTEYKFKYPIPLPSVKDDDFAKKHKLDLIHSQHPWGVGRYAMEISRKLNIPIVFTNHTMYSFYVDYLPKVIPRKLLARFIEANVTKYANKADAVVAPTKHIKEFLIKKGIKTPIYVVPTGVDPESLLQAPDGNLKEKFNIPEDHKIIFNLSRLAPEKNVTTLIQAFKYVTDKRPKTTLVIADDGPDKEKLQQLAKDLGVADRIIFLGRVPFNERGGYFREGDVFMHASLSETQGLVMVDSLIVGVPVVAIKATGVIDVIEDGVSGIITQNTPQDLAKHTLRVLEDSKLRETLSKGAQKRGRVYGIETTARQMEKVYQSVIKTPA